MDLSHLNFGRELHAFIGVILRHVRKNDCVALFQTADDFHAVYRTAAELYCYALRVSALVQHFEKTDGTIWFAMYRAADVKHIGHILDFNCAVNALVGARAERQGLVEADIPSDSAVDRRSIHPRNMSFHNSVARIHGS